MNTAYYDYHIFEHTDGNTWRFYFSDTTICYKTDDTLESPVNILIENIKMYDMVLDENYGIHMLCVTTDNMIYYITHKHDEWKMRTIKKCPSNAFIDSLHILHIQRTIHLFFTFVYHSNPALGTIYHMDTSSRWKLNEVTAIKLLKNMKTYFIDYTTKGEILLLYPIFSLNKWMNQVKVYSPMEKKWSQPKKIKINGNSTDIEHIYIDSNNHLHVLYHYGSKTYWEAYTFKNHNTFVKLTLLSKCKLLEHCNAIQYSLFEFKHVLWFIWNTDDQVHYSQLDTKGQEWSKENTLNLEAITSVYYIGNRYKETHVYKPLITYRINENQSYYLLGMDTLTDFSSSSERDYVENNIHTQLSAENTIHEELNSESDESLDRMDTVENYATMDEESIYEETIDSIDEENDSEKNNAKTIDDKCICNNGPEITQTYPSLEDDFNLPKTYTEPINIEQNSEEPKTHKKSFLDKLKNLFTK